MADILVLYYSARGSVRQLADVLARGVESVPGMRARVRTVPRVAPVTQSAEPGVPPEGAPYVEAKDLAECAGLAMGSPTRFGNMAAPLKHFLDGLAGEWTRGTLEGKPAAVFTSSSTMHGGQETTLVTMMIPLLHHGMYLVGLPFTAPALNRTRTGGSPYGATHLAVQGASQPKLSDDERELAQLLGRRLAELAVAAGAVRRG
jgi:NAD(P)H dehydrogenase (quinone)